MYSSLPHDPDQGSDTDHPGGDQPVLLRGEHPSLPATTVKEFIALAKAKPGGLTMSSSGIATPSHLAGAFPQSAL